jgi:hypothetical protein
MSHTFTTGNGQYIFCAPECRMEVDQFLGELSELSQYLKENEIPELRRRMETLVRGVFFYVLVNRPWCLNQQGVLEVDNGQVIWQDPTFLVRPRLGAEICAIIEELRHLALT